MKLAIKVVLAFALIAATNATEERNDEPVFIRTLKKLQRGPPEQIVHNKADIKTEWITQKLDHFDESETKTWEMVRNKERNLNFRI